MARMEVGMLWFDGDKDRSLQEKIERAGRHYREKYGVEPNVAYVNPAAEGAALDPKNGVEVRQSMEILPDHFWIGVQPVE